jgi:hypothetical protein
MSISTKVTSKLISGLLGGGGNPIAHFALGKKCLLTS